MKKTLALALVLLGIKTYKTLRTKLYLTCWERCVNNPDAAYAICRKPSGLLTNCPAIPRAKTV
jgi:hypothetical protein